MSKFLDFKLVSESPSGKTLIWDVTSEDGSVLGEVSWYSPWRKYVFMPPIGHSEIVFDHACLRDIADFTELKTKEHKAR